MVLIHSNLKKFSVSLWFQLVLEKNRKHEHKTKGKKKKEKQSREWNGVSKVSVDNTKITGGFFTFLVR